MVDGGIAGIVLAGGLARRLGGGDKGLRMVGGRSMLDRVIAAVRPQVAAMALNANGDPARFDRFGLAVIPDAVPGNPGPLAGILAGLDWAAANPDIAWLLSVPSDTPFLPADLVGRLRSGRSAAGADLTCAASGGWEHPVVALWPVSLATALRAALASGVTRITDFTAPYARCVVTWPTDPVDPFFNANRAEELAEADRLARLGIPRPPARD